MNDKEFWASEGWDLNPSDDKLCVSSSGEKIGVDVSTSKKTSFVVPNPFKKDAILIEKSHEHVARELSRWFATSDIVENASVARQHVHWPLSRLDFRRASALQIRGEPPSDDVGKDTYRIGVGAAFCASAEKLSAFFVSSPREPSSSTKFAARCGDAPLVFALGSWPNAAKRWRGPVYGYVPSWCGAAAGLLPTFQTEWDPAFPEASALWFGSRVAPKSVEIVSVTRTFSEPKDGAFELPGREKRWAFPEDGMRLAVWAALLRFVSDEGIDLTIKKDWIPL